MGRPLLVSGELTNDMSSLATARVVTKHAVSRPELRVEVISDYSAFLNLEPVWSRLVREAELDHPFLEHAWARTWWECFGAGSKLHILLVTAGDNPVAIAPLILTKSRMWGIKAWRLGFLYNSHVPRADFIISHRSGYRSEEAYAAIWRHLLTNRRWDLLQLCQLPEGSGTLEAIPRLASQVGCQVGVWESGASPFVPLDTTWPLYCEGLAAKHRANLRNRFKRLERVGAVELETIASGGTLTDAIEDGLGLEGAGWKKEAGTAIACDENLARFYSTFALRAAERGWLRLHFLDSGLKRVAFDYSLKYQNRLFLLKLGYDPAFAPYSPSNLLLAKVLESAFGQGVEKYDFLGETADWKQCWTKESTPNYWLFVFAGTFKGRLLHLIKFRLAPLLKRYGFGHLRGLASRLASLAQRRT
jgi:CelD/BcsL family acetyltransferase involved in cellulose biosynthesis